MDSQKQPATISFLVFQFLDMAVNDLAMNREQISLFCMSLERTMDRLCQFRDEFTLELAERAVCEEIALRKKVAELKLHPPVGETAAARDITQFSPQCPELVQ